MGATCCVSEAGEEQQVVFSYASDTVAMFDNLAPDKTLRSEKCVRKQNERRTEIDSEKVCSIIDNSESPPEAVVLFRSFEPLDQDDHEMFFVSVEVVEDRLGLEVDLTELDAVLVDSVGSGAILKWNADHPHLMLRPLDRITVVNGVRGNASTLYSIMSSCGSLNMVVVRPRFLNVTLNREKVGLESLGLDMTFCHGCSTIYICDVMPIGVVSRWNSSFPQLCIRPGDRIVQVDDITGSAALLKEHILSLENMKIKVMPLLAEISPGIRIDFETGDGSLVSWSFSKSPLGFNVERKLDQVGNALSVSEVACGCSADCMGVRTGWILLAIAGISLRGLTYEKQEVMFHDLTSILAQTRSWYF